MPHLIFTLQNKNSNISIPNPRPELLNWIHDALSATQHAPMHSIVAGFVYPWNRVIQTQLSTVILCNQSLKWSYNYSVQWTESSKLAGNDMINEARLNRIRNSINTGVPCARKNGCENHEHDSTFWSWSACEISSPTLPTTFRWEITVFHLNTVLRCGYPFWQSVWKVAFSTLRCLLNCKRWAVTKVTPTNWCLEKISCPWTANFLHHWRQNMTNERCLRGMNWWPVQIGQATFESGRMTW